MGVSVAMVSVRRSVTPSMFTDSSQAEPSSWSATSRVKVAIETDRGPWVAVVAVSGPALDFGCEERCRRRARARRTRASGSGTSPADRGGLGAQPGDEARGAQPSEPDLTSPPLLDIEKAGIPVRHSIYQRRNPQR
ncbi:MAG: hypothetical protein QOE89_4194 [Pseudonocardiales bacterium]|nr:hypothetical protein [Pseudonocardiales bacterium]